MLPLLVKVSDRSLPLQPYEPCSGEDVTGLVTPATVTVASSVTAETGKQFLEAEISSRRPMDGVLVGVSGQRTRCALPDLTREAEMPQNPRSEPVGSLAQLLLPGLGLVGVGEPNRSRGAGSPTPGHTSQRILLVDVTLFGDGDGDGDGAGDGERGAGPSE